MRLKFEPSGTHLHKGQLKIRVDVFPEPTDACYSKYYVDLFDRQPTEEELADPAKLALIPTHKEVTPCLCHFIRIDKTDKLASLQSKVAAVFDADTLSQLDFHQARDNSLQAVGSLMRQRGNKSAKRVTAIDRNIDPSVCDDKAQRDKIGLKVKEAGKLKTVMTTINTRLADLEVKL